jgi:amidophosphoribosyltransferase
MISVYPLGEITLDRFHEECAIMGAWNDATASEMVFLGLYAQQHRGQEASGIVSLIGDVHIERKGMGLVGDIFTAEILSHLKGSAAIGHNRYSTTGGNILSNTQPLTARLQNGPIALAHNGNIVNSAALRRDLIEKGAIFQGTNDTEALLHLLARNRKTNIIDCLLEEAPKMIGAFSLLLLTKESLVAVRDPLGFRPLVIGQKQNEDGSMAYYFTSETCALDLIGAQYMRDVLPGEIVWADSSGLHSKAFATTPPSKTAHCVFEHVYFARPDSIVYGRSVYQSRKNMGAQLAFESPIDADVIVPVPDSGVPAAIGYSQKSGIPFEYGIIRNHYIGRTFIQPIQAVRASGVKIKLNPQPGVLAGKRVVLVDDSLVRGTTSQKIIRLVRAAGAKEVHLRISSPPTVSSCYYGVDTPMASQLIASSQSTDAIKTFIGADSLSYLSHEGMMKAVQAGESGFCSACFDRQYPTPLFELEG